MGAVMLVGAAAIVMVVSYGWPPWPHRESRDLAALESLAPDVPGGRLYWDQRTQTGCSWTDCTEARLQRRYVVPCTEVDQYATRLGQQLERRGFPASRRLDFGEYNVEGSEEWDSGFVPADVSGGKAWADYFIFGPGVAVVPSMFPEVSDAEIATGCTLGWTLSVTDP
jgi:hypothetical protein